VLEDILNTDQRPKIEVYGDYVYLVLKMLYDGDLKRPIETEQVSLILGSNFVISFQEGKEGDVFNPVRRGLRVEKGLLENGFGLLSIPDRYDRRPLFPHPRETGGEKSSSRRIGGHPTGTTLHEIRKFKNEMIFVRRVVWPLREVVSGLGRKESP